MKRLLLLFVAILISFAIGSPANAQTATFTPGPLCGAGYYEETASCVLYTGSWSSSSATGPSGGTFKFSTTVGNTLTFRMYGTSLVIYRRTSSTGTTANVCIDASCQTVSFFSATTLDMQAISYEVSCLTVCTVSITHNGAGGSAVDLDAFAIYANAPTDTPIPTATPITPAATWTNQVVTAAATWTNQVITPIPQFTQLPFPTPPPYLTQIPPLTQEPQFTQLPFPTPLDTWTPYPTPAEQFTQLPFPTPLDTWTAQPNVVITFDGTFVVMANVDWNGLLTIFPTLITQVPPTNTPGETFTPSITPTLTPPGYMQIDLPNAEGTTVATGTLVMQATAGEVGNMILLFFLSLIGLIFIVRAIFEGRKSPL